MKLVNYVKNGREKSGVLVNDQIIPLGQGDGADFISDVLFNVPTQPTKIICVGMNYAKHVSEMKYERPSEPVLFIKPNTSMIVSGDNIVWPAQSTDVQFEGELGVVISKPCRNVSKEDALNFVEGYCVVNDVTARDLQKMDGQWLNAKGFDTFLPISMWVETDVDYKECVLTSKVNGEIRQEASLSEMLFSVEEVIEYVSSIMTLIPGDLICMGTPAGDKRLNVGDHVEIDISNIGNVSSFVVK